MNPEKTRCPQGHPYDEANTHLKYGYRNCRTCDREYQQRRRDARKPVPTQTRAVGTSFKCERKAFHNARQRCNNPAHPLYSNYGARGIKMLWLTFDSFLADMGPRPPGLSLDRINNDGNYEPGNCRWTDMVTQNNNRRPRTTKTRLAIERLLTTA